MIIMKPHPSTGAFLSMGSCHDGIFIITSTSLRKRERVREREEKGWGLGGERGEVTELVDTGLDSQCSPGRQ